MTDRLAEIASLIADPTRAEMLVALMEGSERTATELAALAQVAPSTASHHLNCLIQAGMVKVVRRGRNKFHRLTAFEVAELIERMGTLDLTTPKRPAKQVLRNCRSCYDHLAGRVGVAVRQRFESSGFIVEAADGYDITSDGKQFFRDFGIDTGLLQGNKRSFARACVDWTERVPHIGGSLGAAILNRLFEKDWLRRGPVARHILVTNLGRQSLCDLGVLLD